MTSTPIGTPVQTCVHWQPRGKKKCDQSTCIFYVKGGDCRNGGSVLPKAAPRTRAEEYDPERRGEPSE